MAEKKHSLLALINILNKYSDIEHPLTIKDIQTHLLNEYSLDLDRRTLYTSMESLRQFGYDISDYESAKGYYLMERQFEKGEILLLCNAIHASHFISAKQSDDLIKKLLDTQSKYQQKEFKDKVYMANPAKTNNIQLMLNLEIVSEAIRDNKKLSFTYLKYNLDKKMTDKRCYPYVVEPRYIVYADSRPYMIVTSENHEDFIHYRIDRMKDAAVLNEKSRKLPKENDPYEYARNKLFMYSGKTSYVSFKCASRIIDQMIDIFGTELIISPIDDDYFMIRINTSDTGAIFLAQQFMDSIEIIEPESLREKFRQQLKDVTKKYKS